MVAVMSSLRARYDTKYDVCPFLLANGAPAPALMQFSAPVKKHWLAGSRGGPWPGAARGGIYTLPGGGGGARESRAYHSICRKPGPP